MTAAFGAHPPQASCRNRLLSLMTPDDFAAIAPHLEPVRLPKGFPVIAAGALITHVFFPETGIASVVTTSPDGLEAETGLFGRDGMGPSARVLSCDRAPHRIVIQVADDAFRMDGVIFSQVLDASATLRHLLQHYILVMNVQAAFTALSNAVHTVDERLARWLLMCHDRVASDDIALTHEFLSIMLAVRRPTVTSSLHVLEGNGFIRAERGYVVVRNRKALEDFAGDAYGRPEAEYARLIGPMS